MSSHTPISNTKRTLIVAAIVVVALLALLNFETIHTFFSNFEANMVELLKTYGYIILFIWSILEGEMGLIMAGLLTHTGDMNLYVSIFVAGFGGFVGDQIYFWIGRYNKDYIHRNFRSQRRKFALAHLLLKKYGWPIIFVQRYMYGMRTVIPMAIGVTRYSGKMFALINYISALFWAAMTIIPAYVFGEEILNLLHLIKQHWYIALPLGALIAVSIVLYFHKATKKEESS